MSHVQFWWLVNSHSITLHTQKSASRRGKLSKSYQWPYLLLQSNFNWPLRTSFLFHQTTRWAKPITQFGEPFVVRDGFEVLYLNEILSLCWYCVCVESFVGIPGLCVFLLKTRILLLFVSCCCFNLMLVTYQQLDTTQCTNFLCFLVNMINVWLNEI